MVEYGSVPFSLYICNVRLDTSSNWQTCCASSHFSGVAGAVFCLSLIHISEPLRPKDEKGGFSVPCTPFVQSIRNPSVINISVKQILNAGAFFPGCGIFRGNVSPVCRSRVPAPALQGQAVGHAMYGPDDSRAHTLPLHVPVEQLSLIHI